jgi:hypothetical protein
MRHAILPFLLFLLSAFSSCFKSDTTGDGFVEYLIRKGGQSSSPSSYKFYNNQPELRFAVRFDSTARYRTLIPTNQLDINKLYGFADNDKPHHEFSARIGWRWLEEKLELHAYVYNDSVRSSKLIKAVPLQTDIQCSIRVDGKQYVFTVDGTTVTMPRSATSPGALGYRLYPYFGGDETAPQDIRIKIKEY